MTADIGDSYDRTPYESLPFVQTHPDRLAALAQLLGLTCPALETCRVLELGCAAGGNLIPMAVALPKARFFGVDLSPVQIAQGCEVVAALGLPNVRLEAMNIVDIDERIGAFDFIIAHGVYSWVPDDIQTKIFDICARQLSPDGIAYVSYNALPGWHMRGMIRDLMQYHAAQFAEPAERVRQARGILDFLAKSVPDENSAYARMLKSELDVVRRKPDYYILHDHLEQNNEPIYFHQFVERAAKHGLRYLCDADFGKVLAANFPAEVRQTLARIAPDVIRQEQFIDFLRNNTFRQSLLVHEQRMVDRNLTPDRLASLWISGALQPVGAPTDVRSGAAQEFRSARGVSFRTAVPITKAAATVLGERWPEATAFDDLLAQARTRLGTQRAPSAAGDGERAALAADLLRIFAGGLFELHAMPSPFATRVGERPCASALARLQARHTTTVTNLRHESVHIDENVGRLLQLIDGTRTRDEIGRVLFDWTPVAEAGNRPRAAPSGVMRERVGDVLQRLSKAALLLATAGPHK